MRVADIDELRHRLLARPHLWSTSIEITGRCNLRCRHCLRQPAGLELSFADLCDVLDQLQALGCFKIVFTGGEPFVRPDFPALVEQAWQRRFAISILTNATLLTPHLVALCRRNHVAEIQASIYGMSAARHDVVTGLPGSYQRAVHGIELALAVGLKVSIATPIMALNAGEVPGIRSAWQQRGAAFTGGALLFPRQDGDRAPLALVASDEQLGLALADGDATCEGGHSAATAPLSTLCPAGIERLAIGVDGTIYPCDAWRLPAGNVRRDRLAGVWLSGAVFIDLRSRRREHGAACAGCGVRPQCTWCPGLSQQLLGDPALPNAQDCRRTRLTYGRHTADQDGWSVPAAVRSVQTLT